MWLPDRGHRRNPDAEEKAPKLATSLRVGWLQIRVRRIGIGIGVGRRGRSEPGLTAGEDPHGGVVGIL